MLCWLVEDGNFFVRCQLDQSGVSYGKIKLYCIQMKYIKWWVAWGEMNWSIKSHKETQLFFV